MVVDLAKNSGRVSVELMSFNGEAVVDHRGERERERERERESVAEYAVP